ncbi:ribosome maturation factor RimP [Paenibacillus sp. N1-5-1-14]|uniref:ribosome maturation factor RimP n=1 Tax=Paenibacillus radicibacter TaxID=2972488 RepID=UPI00215932EB|nr:ribosome maturation factor RimP [Paenibacillus radicibacter]MCR8642151.1 ribosome maturation factor RimP [Paenibacillus radicibacter]
MSTGIKAHVEDLLKEYMDEHGYEIVDIEYVKEGSNWFLRIYVDKEGGIDIDDCSNISEYASARLDENDPITTAYFLEVSSPGAERPLKKADDVRKAVGKNVFVTTYEPINGVKEFEGELLSFDGEELVVKTVGKVKKQYSIPYNKVASARLAIVF